MSSRPRMRAAKFTETLNAEDDTMPKKMLGLQRFTPPNIAIEK